MATKHFGVDLSQLFYAAFTVFLILTLQYFQCRIPQS